MGYCCRLDDSKFYVSTENTGRVLARTKRSSFEFKMDKDGNLTGVELRCEKLGDNDYKSMQKIAPWVKEGSFLEFLWEDGERSRWIFKNGGLKEIEMQCYWEENDE